MTEENNIYKILNEQFKERRTENDDRYAFKEFEFIAKQNNKILYGMVAVILLAVIGAILRSIGL